MSKPAVENATRVSHYEFDPDDVIIIGRDTKDGPEHKLWERRALRDPNETYVLGIMQYGVLSACIGRKRAEDGKVEITDGRGRVIDCREANKRLRAMGKPPKVIKVVLEKHKEADIGAIKMIANTHRTDLDLWTLAENAAQMKSTGSSWEDVALACGRTGDLAVKWAQDLVSILDVIPEVRNVIQAGAMPYTAAVRFARLSPEKQREALIATAEALAPMSRDDGGNPLSETPSAPTPSGASSEEAAAKAAAALVGTTGRGGRKGSGAARAALKATGDAARGGSAKKKNANAIEPKYVPPTRTTLIKIANMGTEARLEAGLDPVAYETVRIMLGLAPTSRVQGMTNVIRRLTGVIQPPTGEDKGQ